MNELIGANGLIGFLTAQVAEDERLARQVGLDDDQPDLYVYDDDHSHNTLAITSGRMLREVAAKRALLADLLAEPHFLNNREWYGCRAMAEGDVGGPDIPTGEACTCGRDANVERRIRILAQPYEDRPGWKEKWRVS
jgi:hypothetical protein